MQIQINYANVEHSDSVDEHIEGQVKSALGRWAGRLTRVEVHLKDVNGPKSGTDQLCTMEARLAGDDPCVAEHQADGIFEAVTGAADKLQRVIERRVDRRNER